MKVPQLQVMMENARAFHDISIKAVESYKKLGDEDTLQHNSLLVVSATNMMFSIELIFKAFLLFTTGKFESGHKIYDLYLKLPEQVKNELILAYEGLRELAPVKVKPWALFTTMDGKEPAKKVYERYSPKLIAMLKVHDEGFVRWRYSFEIQQNPVLIFDFYNMRLLFLAIESVISKEMSKYLH